MLKADLHLHAGEDKFHKLGYSSKELIDLAAQQGFEVLALTFHKDVFYYRELGEYAKNKGILLIPGVEREIEGKEVLIYNVTDEEAKKTNTFDDLRALRKKKDIIIIAPHPYFKRGECLGKKLEENIDLFDGIEYSHFYLKSFNLNRKAENIAKKHSLPLIGTSDAHNLWQLGYTYAMIDSGKDMALVFKAIRKGKVRLVTRPIPFIRFVVRMIKVTLSLE